MDKERFRELVEFRENSIAQIADLSQQLRWRDDTIKNKKARIKNQSTTIASLRSTSQKLRSTNARVETELEATLKERTDIVAKLFDIMNEKDRRLWALEKELSLRSDTIEDYRKTNDRLRKRIEEYGLLNQRRARDVYGKDIK
jgi:chromosome segregation ATPase